MKKITEIQARVIARGLIQFLKEQDAATGIAVLDNPQRLATLLGNVSDDVAVDTEFMESEEAKNTIRNEQWEEAQTILRNWMTRVYTMEPKLEDGVVMKLTFEGGLTCGHPKHDFSLFAFKAEAQEEVGDF